MAFIKVESEYLVIELYDDEQYLVKNNVIMIADKKKLANQKEIDEYVASYRLSQSLTEKAVAIFKATGLPENIIASTNKGWYNKAKSKNQKL